MKILVCPLSKVMNMVDIHTPERIVSLLDPNYAFPETGPAYFNRHLRLCFNDIHVSTKGQVLPTAKHIDELLAFISLWSRKAPILIHCRAGIGRSTATAFITACLHNPKADEMEIASALRRASPLARPNETLIQLADAAMSRSGRMNNAIAETGRNLSWPEVIEPLKSYDEGVPFEIPATFGFAPHAVNE
ncbi:MAG: tyrosine protein phosphatase [Anaerolineae bacterium]|nr:tyrosine protein phosphatase [Anaerolineae bacterium]